MSANVAVLGDVRLHFLTLQRRKEELSSAPLGETRNVHSAVLAGGAKLMAQACELAIASDELDARVISYVGDSFTWLDDKNRGESIGCNHWTLKPTHLTNTTMDSRLRLMEPMSRVSFTPWLPDFPIAVADQEVVKNLAAVVINDLGAKFRDIPLQLSKPGDSEGKSIPAKHETHLGSFLTGFADLVKAQENNRLPPLGPVLIISVDSPLPDNRPVEPGRDDSLWPWLAECKKLHDRTIIILDADQLRREGFRISEGLSWERTAQDVVTSLRRSPRLASLRKFQHLIVLFGVTGAVYAFHGGRDWHYDLYFDPTKDDTTFVDPKQDGRVLGASSVVVACLLQSLLSTMQRTQTPHLGTLGDVISCGLREALTRTQLLYYRGYGDEQENIEELFQKIKKTPFPNELFARPLPQDIAANCSVSRIEVPIVRTSGWSILGQSCDFRFSQVAQDIVLHGPAKVLNLPEWPTFDLLSSDLACRFRRHRQEKGANAGDKGQGEDIVRSMVKELVNDLVLFGTRPASVLNRALETIVEAIHGQPSLEEHIAKCPEIDMVTLREGLRGQLATVEESLKRLVDDTPVVAPVARFGTRSEDNEHDNRMVVVDRQEIEGFRTLCNLIKSHLDQVSGSLARDKVDSRSLVERPLSIAVFGPPGSGKSFAVKRIVESVQSGVPTKWLSFNVAQFSHTDHLENAFQEVNNTIAERKVPIVFLDEFDTAFDDDELGWLKFFLAPMEDGAFRKFTVKDAVLVFAGGINRTFSEFSRDTRARSDPQWAEFSRAKGPDFISRLQGHVNLAGINPVSPTDELFVIRRAVLLRSLLCNMLDIADSGEARIEPNLLHALLHVAEYKHGGRSLRILLNHCIRRGVANRSFLPTLGQLNMHIDGKSFLDVLNRTDELGDIR